MARPRAGLTDGFKLAVALIALLVAANNLVARFYAEEGLDFYHFWGIAAARSLRPTASDLGGPYAQAAAYTVLLNRASDASSDPRFKQANRRRRTASRELKTLFDPTGTPLCYMSFAFLPSQYSIAHTLYRGLQFGSFVAGVILFFALLRRPRLNGLLVASLLAAFFVPFASDVAVGNTNSFQLLGLVAILACADRVTREPTRFSWTHAAFACGLVGFSLFKPNFSATILFLALFYLARCGTRLAGTAALVGSAFGILLVASSALYFDSSAVWVDWWQYLNSGNATKLLSYQFNWGNRSSPRIASWLLNRTTEGAATGPYGTSLVFAALLFGSLALALRSNATRIRPHAAALLSDPLLAASLGVLVDFGTAILVWDHYQVILLIPALWLVTRRGRFTGLRGLSLATLFYVAVGTRVYGFLFEQGIHFAWYGRYAFVFQSFAWLPLWIHLLAEVSHGGEQTRARDLSNPL